MNENEPLQITVSKEALIRLATNFIRSTYPSSDRDTRHARLGLLVDFITELFEPGKPE